MTTSLKVPVATLLQSAERERAAIVEKHRLAVESYRDDTEEVRGHLVDRLRALADDLESGRKLPKPSQEYDSRRGYVWNITAAVSAGVRERPPAKPDTRRVDSDIRLLRATSQETVTVRTGSSFERYL